MGRKPSVNPMDAKLAVRLSQETKKAIEKFAEQEDRTIDGATRYLINEALKNRGLLPQNKSKE